MVKITARQKHLTSFTSLVLMVCLLIALGGILLQPFFKGESPLCMSTEKGSTYSDFVCFYRVSAMLCSPDRSGIYDRDALLKWTKLVLAPGKPNYVLPGAYPPYFLLLLAPLCLLPINGAYLVWNCLSLLLASVGLWMLLKRRNDWTKMDKAIFILGVLCSAPGLINLRLGQSSLFLLAFISLSFVLLTRNPPILAGLVLGLASFKPHYAVFVAYAMLLQKRLAVVATAVSMDILLTLCAVFVCGWAAIASYPYALLQWDAIERNSGYGQSLVSLRGLFGTWLPPQMDLPVSGGLALLSFVAVTIIYLQLRAKPSARQEDWAIAIVVLISITISPHSFIQDCVLMAFVAALSLPTVNPAEVVMLPTWRQRIYALMWILYPLLTWITYLTAALKGQSLVSLVIVNLVMLALAIWNYRAQEWEYLNSSA